MNQADINALLHDYASRYETEDFLADDPALFMHLVSGRKNQEAMAFIASVLSYGSRKQFFPKIRYILNVSEGDVWAWVKSGDFNTDITDKTECYYRLYTYHDMNVFLHALQRMIIHYGSIGEFISVNATDGISAIRAITDYFARASQTRLIPKNISSACKRLCMFMRWMVRSGSPVDLGLWSEFIDRRTLIMPLDTHVMQQARRLGLITNRAASMSTARRLTDKMKEFFPDDPLKGDFALFGYGVNDGL